MNLDLSALDNEDAPVIDGAGTVKRAPLSQFKPDARQLARERDEEADNRDRADIKANGVMSPIIVGEQDEDGLLPIRFGHRRWRLSGEAGLEDAPYIHEIPGVTYDQYAQLAENRNRKNESPMDIAEAIVEGKKRGEKNKYIADRIGIDASEVTHHLVLIEGPDFIRTLYTEKKCRTPKYLYELANLAKEFPEEVREFCASSDNFTWKTIVAFRDQLRGLGNTKENSADSGALAPEASRDIGQAATLDNAQSDIATASGLAQPSLDAPAAGPINKPEDAADEQTEPLGNSAPEEQNASTPGNGGLASDQADGQDDTDPAAAHIPGHNPDIEKDADKILADPSKIKKPLLLGSYNGDDVMVNLYKRPTTPGMVFVKYENGNGEAEVEFGQVTNLTLTESRI